MKTMSALFDSERIEIMSDMINIPEIFGCDVFNEATMKQRLAPEIYVSWKQCIANGTFNTHKFSNVI